MKKVIFYLFFTYLLVMGLVLAIDLTLVLSGQVIPVSYPEYGLSWNNSPIFGYNVSRMANLFIGMMAVMGLLVAAVMIANRPRAKHYTYMTN